MNIRLFFPAALMLCLLACGGGGGGGSVADGGIGGTGAPAQVSKTYGSITGFGSIFVNGIEFDTRDATVVIDDNPGVESELALGMVVTIKGTVEADGQRGSALEIEFDNDLLGPVAAISPNADNSSKTLSIMGVSVLVDSLSTTFAAVSYDTLAVDDLVEVSGFVTADGQLQASRIEKKGSFVDGVSEVESKGLVVNLNEASSTFTLGGLEVDYSAADLSEVPGGLIANGMLVEVKGVLNGTVLSAARIEQEAAFFGDDEDKVSIEGLVTDFVSNGNFRVGGVQVDASSALFSPATLALANNLKVEVEGPIVAGVLRAISVEARAGNIELSARVDGVDSANRTVRLRYGNGTATFQVTSSTRLEDDRDDVDPMTFGAIAPLDYLEVKVIDDGNSLLATEVRRRDYRGDVLQGPVDSFISLTSITVLNVSFNVSGASFQGLNEEPLSATQFYSQLDLGDIVKITDSDGNGSAGEVEFEN